MLGRSFNDGDLETARFTVLLGYELWQTRFGGDPGVIDKVVQIPERPPRIGGMSSA